MSTQTWNAAVSYQQDLQLIREFDESVWSSLKSNLRDVFFPEKLPPLRLTSRPVRVRDIWGEYSHKKRSAAGTITLHAILLSGIIWYSLMPHHPAAEPPKNQVVDLVAPDISVYQPVMKPQEMGGGTGGGIFHVGGSVTAPRVLYQPDPEYTEEARKAKYQGVCVIWLIVGPDGQPRDVRVARTLGMGLDQKAIDAVRQWKFDPAR